MRHYCTLLLLLFLLPIQAVEASIPAINTKSGKYAALVMDADTGEVFYARNADAKRYPASLTKMMTLYMLFEALKAKQVDLDTPMPVSKLAASQPQTNISLNAGQTIRVEDAIKALVVRSANDVAVVVAEKLGRNEPNFAVMMTRKARQLGMNKTQFRNPHGLPDTQQYTSARDMAKLSIALRRDFPQYYHYFETKSFSWKGRTYNSHNHVLDQFSGVDGIKTGYINMSGFNLASSVKRDGYHVVAVVMGGQTSRSRDAHMVSLLDKTFTTIAERGDEPRRFAQVPLPTPKPQAEERRDLPWIRLTFNTGEKKAVTSLEDRQAAAPADVVMASSAAESSGAAQAAGEAQGDAIPLNVATETALGPEKVPSEKTANPRKSFFNFVSQPDRQQLEQQNTLNFQLASLNHSPKEIRQKWGIQVGAFRDAQSALQAASKAMQQAQNYLKYSTIDITDHGREDVAIHRARLANLTEKQAKRACQQLSSSNTPCFVFRIEQMQNL